MTQLVKVSDGRARRINLLADKALLAAYAGGASLVDIPHVKAAMAELPGGQLSTGSSSAGAVWNKRSWQLAGIGLAVAMVPALIVLALLRPAGGNSGPPAADLSQQVPAPVLAPTGLAAPLHFESMLATVPKPRKPKPLAAPQAVAQPAASDAVGVKPDAPASATE
jgi:hypothetical protein